MVKKVEGYDMTSLLSGKELKVVIPNVSLTCILKFIIEIFVVNLNSNCIIKLPPATMVFKNATDHAIGFGGIIYNELEWLSLKLNFRFVVCNFHT